MAMEAGKTAGTVQQEKDKPTQFCQVTLQVIASDVDEYILGPETVDEQRGRVEKRSKLRAALLELLRRQRREEKDNAQVFTNVAGRKKDR